MVFLDKESLDLNETWTADIIWTSVSFNFTASWIFPGLPPPCIGHSSSLAWSYQSSQVIFFRRVNISFHGSTFVQKTESEPSLPVRHRLLELFHSGQVDHIDVATDQSLHLAKCGKLFTSYLQGQHILRLPNDWIHLLLPSPESFLQVIIVPRLKPPPTIPWIG